MRAIRVQISPCYSVEYIIIVHLNSNSIGVLKSYSDSIR